MAQTTKASPALLERIDRLAGCQGHWLLIRDGEPERDCSHQWHHSPDRHLATCLAEHWRNVSLGFVPSLCGYSSYSNLGLVGKANFNVLTDSASTPDPLGGILTVGYDWNGEGVVLDVLRVPVDVIETVEALESYCLISDDEHSELQLQAQQEAWESWAADDWRKLVQKALAQYAPENADLYWEEERLDAVPDLESKLAALFHACAEEVGEYWEEDGSCGQWIRLERVAEKLDRQDLVELTGLALLAPDQDWRREPYPWPGAEAAPLEPSLPV